MSSDDHLASLPPPRAHELYSKLAQAFRSAPPRPLVSCPHLLRAGSARRRRRREAVNDRTTGSQDLSCNGMRRRRRSDTSTRRDGTSTTPSRAGPRRAFGPRGPSHHNEEKSFCSVVLACWGPGDPLLRELWTRTSGVWGDEQDIWQAARSERGARSARTTFRLIMESAIP
jgi:hypothetical protein